MLIISRNASLCSAVMLYMTFPGISPHKNASSVREGKATHPKIPHRSVKIYILMMFPQEIKCLCYLIFSTKSRQYIITVAGILCPVPVLGKNYGAVSERC
jgi:hypothetical protein